MKFLLLLIGLVYFSELSIAQVCQGHYNYVKAEKCRIKGNGVEKVIKVAADHCDSITEQVSYSDRFSRHRSSN